MKYVLLSVFILPDFNLELTLKTVDIIFVFSVIP